MSNRDKLRKELTKKVNDFIDTLPMCMSRIDREIEFSFRDKSFTIVLTGLLHEPSYNEDGSFYTWKEEKESRGEQ